jgi:hypothetical protein
MGLLLRMRLSVCDDAATAAMRCQYAVVPIRHGSAAPSFGAARLELLNGFVIESDIASRGDVALARTARGDWRAGPLKISKDK